MGKLLLALNRQLKTEHKKDAEKCIKIYEALKKESNGHVWSSEWNMCTRVEFKGVYPNFKRIYSPKPLGLKLIE